MKNKYSKEQFDGYTHRFVVTFTTKTLHSTSINIYSNSNSYQDLDDIIYRHKSDDVIDFTVTHRASKEDDEIASQIIDEIFNKQS
ncbi:MAG: hypothetical protein WAT79_08590 [Saprospiraceae bacterium]